MYYPKSVHLHESIETVESDDFFDVLIIGGGKKILFSDTSWICEYALFGNFPIG
jgi:hypothetical protein